MFESLGFVYVPSADLDTERPTRRDGDVVGHSAASHF
jgi:hypothetical protein